MSDIVGELYHFAGVSAAFGLTYALIMGRTRWWGGLIRGLIISYSIALGLLLERYVRHEGPIFGLLAELVRRPRAELSPRRASSPGRG